MKNRDSSLDKKSDVKILRFLLPYLWPQGKIELKMRIILACIFLLVSKVTNVYMPILYKSAIDALGVTYHQLSWVTLPVVLIFAYGAARFGAQLFNELKDMITAKVEQNAMRCVALDVFTHLHKLSLRFHLDRKMGSLSRVVERGVKGIETVLRFSVFNIVPGFVEMIFVSAVLWYLYDVRYVVVTLLTLISYVVTTLKLTGWRIAFVRKMFSSENETNTKAVDSLLNYETVKYFGAEEHEARRYNKGLKTYESAAINAKKSLSLLNLAQGFIIASGLVALMLMAAFDVKQGRMNIGDFVLVNTYLIQLYMPLNILGFAYREIKLSLASMEEMFDLLHIPQEVQDKTEVTPYAADNAKVCFDRVSFHYNPDRPILQDVSFTVEPGKTCAIVGSSGAGKSTISRLLFRFYDATGGAITLDGIDIRDISQSDLRYAIGMVPQDTVLFNDTIAYNIGYGNPDATRDDIISVSKMAKIHDFIASLPEGYETAVGERGLKLSGGEKQRVAIARTLLKKPAIFIFDEATSALDTQTEKEIQDSLKDISKDHTTIMVAHRLSTVVDADEIVVLDHGRIVERGTHDDLLLHKGHYAKMWARQLKTH